MYSLELTQGNKYGVPSVDETYMVVSLQAFRYIIFCLVYKNSMKELITDNGNSHKNK